MAPTATAAAATSGATPSRHTVVFSCDVHSALPADSLVAVTLPKVYAAPLGWVQQVAPARIAAAAAAAAAEGQPASPAHGGSAGTPSSGRLAPLIPVAAAMEPTAAQDEAGLAVGWQGVLTAGSWLYPVVPQELSQ